MKARICDDGSLEILRRGKWKMATCPFHAEMCECGDWCPLFHETDGSLLILNCGQGRATLELVGDARPDVKEAT